MKRMLEGTNWSEGTLRVPHDDGTTTVCHYWVKHYEEPSEYGIDAGRSSKLAIKIGEKLVCNYDRGWDIRPTCDEADVALQILMHDYN